MTPRRYHTSLNTHTHAYTPHTHIHTCRHKHKHTHTTHYTHTHHSPHTYIHTNAHIHTYTNTHTYMHTQTHHTHTTQTHTRTHTHATILQLLIRLAFLIAGFNRQRVLNFKLNEQLCDKRALAESAVGVGVGRGRGQVFTLNKFLFFSGKKVENITHSQFTHRFDSKKKVKRLLLF